MQCLDHKLPLRKEYSSELHLNDSTRCQITPKHRPDVSDTANVFYLSVPFISSTKKKKKKDRRKYVSGVQRPSCTAVLKLAKEQEKTERRTAKPDVRRVGPW